MSRDGTNYGARAFHRAGRCVLVKLIRWSGGLLLRVKDWTSHFENHKTRILKRMEWVLIPNKMDGDGYTELVDHPDGASHYGVWIALLMIASRSEPRGYLARSGGTAHDSASLARLSRLESGVITAACARLLKIGWLIEGGDNPAFSGADTAKPGVRIERNGTEGKGRERNGREAQAPRAEKPPPPLDPLTLSVQEFDTAWERHRFYTGNRGLDSDKGLVLQTILSVNGQFDVGRFRDRHPLYCHFHEHTKKPWNEFGVLSMLSWIRAGMPLPPEKPEDEY